MLPRHWCIVDDIDKTICTIFGWNQGRFFIRSRDLNVEYRIGLDRLVVCIHYWRQIMCYAFSPNLIFFERMMRIWQWENMNEIKRKQDKVSENHNVVFLCREFTMSLSFLEKISDLTEHLRNSKPCGVYLKVTTGANIMKDIGRWWSMRHTGRTVPCVLRPSQYIGRRQHVVCF